MANKGVSEIYKIMERARKEMGRVAEEYSYDNMRAIIGNILDSVDGFENVTGNTITGFAVGAYKDGKLVGRATSRERLPAKAVRPQLRKGEVYDLDYAYGGMMRKSYRGEAESSGEYAYDEALKFLEEHRPRKRKGMAYIVVSAADYSKFIEVHKKGNLLTATRDLLASMGAQVGEVKG